MKLIGYIWQRSVYVLVFYLFGSLWRPFEGSALIIGSFGWERDCDFICIEPEQKNCRKECNLSVDLPGEIKIQIRTVNNAAGRSIHLIIKSSTARRQSSAHIAEQHTQ